MREALAGRRVLVVEDEYFLADDLVVALQKAGAAVVGPVGTQEEALALLSAEPCDAAVIDIHLRGKAGFLVADALAMRGVPFVFATGYDPAMIPERHAAVPCWEKPFDLRDLTDALAGLDFAAGGSEPSRPPAHKTAG